MKRHKTHASTRDPGRNEDRGVLHRAELEEKRNALNIDVLRARNS